MFETSAEVFANSELLDVNGKKHRIHGTTDASDWLHAERVYLKSTVGQL